MAWSTVKGSPQWEEHGALAAGALGTAPHLVLRATITAHGGPSTSPRQQPASVSSPAPLALSPGSAPCHPEYRRLRGSSALHLKSRSIRRCLLVRKDIVPTSEGKVTGTHLASWHPNLTTGMPSEVGVLGFPGSLWHISGFHRRAPSSANGSARNQLPPPRSILLPTVILPPLAQFSPLTLSHQISILLSDRP